MLLDAGADLDPGGGDGESLATVARDRGHEMSSPFLETVRGRSPRTSPGRACVGRPCIHLTADANDVEARPSACSMPSRSSCTVAIEREGHRFIAPPRRRLAM